VSQAIAEMEKVTQTIAATAEESAAASEQLNAQAEMSVDGVRQLEQLVSRALRAPALRAIALRSAGPARGTLASIGERRASSFAGRIPTEGTGTYGEL